MLILPRRYRQKEYQGIFIEHEFDLRRASRPAKQIEMPNTLLRTGATWMLQTVFQGLAVTPVTYYLGLTSAGYSWTSTLAALAAGEPVGNGYARQALTKNNVDFTVQEVNGVMQVISKLVTFTCAGAQWTQNWQRGFICDAAAGTVGDVVAVSGPAPTARVVGVGQGPTMQYTGYLRG